MITAFFHHAGEALPTKFAASASPSQLKNDF
jgi:hypothetical protein